MMRGARRDAKFCADTVPLTRTVAWRSPIPTTAVDTVTIGVPPATFPCDCVLR
jgi:hypothetical protein